jgi:hypothetical protein
MVRTVMLSVNSFVVLLILMQGPVSAQVSPSDRNGPTDTSESPSDWEYSDGETGWPTAFDQTTSYGVSYLPLISHCSGFYAGAELVIVKPYWEDEVDTLRETLNIDGVDIEFPIRQLDPGYDCSLSPRIYVGYRDCDGFGARVRYWLYNEAANPLDFDVLNPLSNIVTEYELTAKLNVQALDLEATKRLSDGRFSLEVSGGARYARTHLEAFLGIEQPLNQLLNTYEGRATFEGIGPTISAEALHRIGHSNFSFVGNLRGSLLFGQSSFYAKQTLTSFGSSSESTFVNQGDDDVVPVIEAQIGAEYARRVGHGRLALRAMMEGQWWGIATPGASFSRDLTVPTETDFFNTGRDLGFFGVTAAVIYDF